MSKSDDEEPFTRVDPPRRPAWREKLRALIDEAKSMLEAEEKAPRNKDNPS